jgi:hypothetical protein
MASAFLDELANPQRSLPLSDGRLLLVLQRDGADEIQVRGAAGEVEVRIALTEQGPVVRVSAARLELESADTVDVKCRKFSVQAAEQIIMRSRQEMDVKGRPIRLNVFDGRFDNDYFYPQENGPVWGTAFADVAYEPSPFAHLFREETEDAAPVFAEVPQVLEEVEQCRQNLTTWLHNAARMRQQLDDRLNDFASRA